MHTGFSQVVRKPSAELPRNICCTSLCSCSFAKSQPLRSSGACSAPMAPARRPQHPHRASVRDAARCSAGTRCAERPAPPAPGAQPGSPPGAAVPCPPTLTCSTSTTGSSRACPCSFFLICSPSLRALPAVTIFPVRIRSRYWINYTCQPAGPER